jgi:hypothetical protein
LVAAACSVVVRLRRARDAERQQLKWFAYVGGLGAAALLTWSFVRPDPLIALVWFPALAAAIGMAIFRYRLYDIDRLINRTLVYGLLTAVLGGVYSGVVLVLGEAFGRIGGEPPSWAVAAATLAVAALFQPARRHIQQAVDRRFNRRKYDAAKTVEAFSTRLRTRPIWTRFRTSCLPSSTRRCSQPQRRYGSVHQPKQQQAVKSEEVSSAETA